jgi:hypothetical protein
MISNAGSDLVINEAGYHAISEDHLVRLWWHAATPGLVYDWACDDVRCSWYAFPDEENSEVVEPEWFVIRRRIPPG